jgi:hypothetical protein
MEAHRMITHNTRQFAVLRAGTQRIIEVLHVGVPIELTGRQADDYVRVQLAQSMRRLRLSGVVIEVDPETEISKDTILEAK